MSLRICVVTSQPLAAAHALIPSSSITAKWKAPPLASAAVSKRNMLPVSMAVDDVEGASVTPLPAAWPSQSMSAPSTPRLPMSATCSATWAA